MAVKKKSKPKWAEKWAKDHFPNDGMPLAMLVRAFP